MDSKAFQIYDRDLAEEQLATYLQAEAIAVDTETMGLLPQRDRLCLVQLCDPLDHVAVVRIDRGQAEAPNLKRLLEAASVLKVFHFARFDVATLRYHLDIQVNPIFCTKLASKLARTYTPRHGLKDLVQELEHVELDKSAQSSDWGDSMNLSPEQLRYAANDVRYLLSARKKLMAMLKREERWELAERCFQCIPTMAELDLLQYQGAFEH
ncbi:ribonuclease D [Leptolyngbya sp. FACHB-36]|uniref:ribonuclease H-like domain-containing protein n=1 Tax=Leptolyngbya sp. FACHB-36 TaxID=2692808 RepID=UPI0016804400|nr:ribonuclease H-like domain-containing protein [Leptolyngbya sp. FACHB-36]MBD2019955.1 ribonuclease D [Leptolyngbya sp. FACHB-36]